MNMRKTSSFLVLSLRARTAIYISIWVTTGIVLDLLPFPTDGSERWCDSIIVVIFSPLVVIAGNCSFNVVTGIGALIFFIGYSIAMFLSNRAMIVIVINAIYVGFTVAGICGLWQYEWRSLD